MIGLSHMLRHKLTTI